MLGLIFTIVLKKGASGKITYEANAACKYMVLEGVKQAATEAEDKELQALAVEFMELVTKKYGKAQVAREGQERGKYERPLFNVGQLLKEDEKDDDKLEGAP